jgi:MoaA/NifB/PqqE/SkfB family radical SAM enzyme
MASAFFVVTDKCHLSCEFCFYKVGLNFDKDHRLRPSQMAAVIPQLRELDIREIILTGGDPMLRKDLPEIVRLFTDQGFSVGILTAGDLLNKSKIVELRLAGLALLCLPVDGPFSRPDLQRPGQRGQARNCEIASLVGMYSSVSITITTRNYKLVKEIYDDVRTVIKPDNIVFSPVSIGPESWENQDISLKRLSRTQKVELIQDLEAWAEDYDYKGYLSIIRASLLDEDVDYWPHCTMKKNLIFESNGDVYTCFCKKTPILGLLGDPGLSSSVSAFRDNYRCNCSSDQCVTQFQKKDERKAERA